MAESKVTKTVKMTKGELTVPVVPSAFEAVWKARGWTLADPDAPTTRRELGVQKAVEAAQEALANDQDPRAAFDTALQAHIAPPEVQVPKPNPGGGSTVVTPSVQTAPGNG